MTKCNVRLIREKSIALYVVTAICTVSVEKKKKEIKKTRKTNIFSITEITVRDIFSTLNSYWKKKSTDMFEKYMGKRMGKS